jgi:phosphatidylinositol glycan class N
MVCSNLFLKRYYNSTQAFDPCFGTEFKRKHALFYTPFPLLTPSTNHDQGSDALSYPQLATIENLILEKQWFAARQASSTLIQQALQGLHYLQTYDRFLIRGIVSAAYMGWTAYAVLHILRHRDFRSLGGGKPSSLPTSPTSLVSVGSCIVLLGFWTLFALQRSPWSFYVYIMFPCYFWWRVLEELGTAISDWNYRRAASGMPGSGDRLNGFVTVVIKVATVVLALQGMVVRYSLTCMENVDVPILQLGRLYL